MVVKKQRKIGIEFILGCPSAKAHLHQLMKDRVAIESELGTTVEWLELLAS